MKCLLVLISVVRKISKKSLHCPFNNDFLKAVTPNFVNHSGGGDPRMSYAFINRAEEYRGSGGYPPEDLKNSASANLHHPTGFRKFGPSF